MAKLKSPRSVITKRFWTHSVNDMGDKGCQALINIVRDHTHDLGAAIVGRALGVSRHVLL